MFTSLNPCIAPLGPPDSHTPSYRCKHNLRSPTNSPKITCPSLPHQKSTYTTLAEISTVTGNRRIITHNGNTSTEVIDNDNAITAIQALFLPRGWPDSVTSDYLRYQIWTFPAHITGWMSHALAGSSMLKALGIGAGPIDTVGFSAGIKWVTKDGLGAIGRMIVGGGLSSKFDEDPRRWRMIAELVTSTGLALEIATQVFPGNFIVLAGTGNLCKAIGRGMGRPCFRVVQTHFSANNNVGDVAAKEEVWEVSAQLIGLALSVALLSGIEAAGNPEAIVPLWTGIHSMHVALRYLSLKQLDFAYPNYKRATLLVTEHVAGRELPSVEQGNRTESIWASPSSCSPRVVFGCSVEEALAAGGGGGSFSSIDNSNSNGSSGSSGGGGDVADLLEIYSAERYILTWRDETAHVVLWEDAKPIDYMRALWQAAWLTEHVGVKTSGNGVGGGVLKESVAALSSSFDSFFALAEDKGWELNKTTLPLGPIRLQRNI